MNNKCTAEIMELYVDTEILQISSNFGFDERITSSVTVK